MAIMLLSLLVGAGVKELVKLTSNNTSDKAIVVSTESTSMHNTASPFVLETVNADLDCAGQSIVERDSVEIETEGPTKPRVESTYLDDS